jgi:hypothetical protein
LFAANATLAADEAKTIKNESDEVKCSGINSCKGQGSCAGVGHECALGDGRKGKGWVKVGSARRAPTRAERSRELASRGAGVVSPGAPLLT